MSDRQPKAAIIVGIGAAISILTALWWHGELNGRVGSTSFHDSFICLAKLGTGDCGALWLLGLHQENQIAGAIFWLGIAVAAFGIWQSTRR